MDPEILKLEVLKLYGGNVDEAARGLAFIRGASTEQPSAQSGGETLAQTLHKFEEFCANVSDPWRDFLMFWDGGARVDDCQNYPRGGRESLVMADMEISGLFKSERSIETVDGEESEYVRCFLTPLGKAVAAYIKQVAKLDTEKNDAPDDFTQEQWDEIKKRTEPYQPTTSESASTVQREGASAETADADKPSDDALEPEDFATDEDEGCPVGDPDCEGRSDQCHDACEPPETPDARSRQARCADCGAYEGEPHRRDHCGSIHEVTIGGSSLTPEDFAVDAPPPLSAEEQETPFWAKPFRTLIVDPASEPKDAKEFGDAAPVPPEPTREEIEELNRDVREEEKV